MVIVPVRLLVDVLGEQVAATLALLLPEAGERLSQSCDSETVQLVLAEMLKLWLPPLAVKLSVVGDTFTTGATPLWVIVMVCELTPSAVTVILPVRLVVWGLLAQVIATWLSLLPEVRFTLSQSSDSLTLHAKLDLMLNVWLPPGAPKDKFKGETLNVALPAAWVMLMD